jgi:predicted ATP-grasp superfamily ATP-dependent carboligase
MSYKDKKDDYNKDKDKKNKKDNYTKEEVDDDFNNYDLDARDATGPTMLGAEKIYTEEEKQELLADYFEVPRVKWRQLPVRGWCRFINNEGVFSAGGMVLSVNADESVKYGWVGTGAYKNVFFKDTAKIYKKFAYGAGIEIDMCVNSIKNLNEYVKKLKIQVSDMERKIEELERKISHKH